MRRRLERLAASPGFASGSELSNIKMLADGAARREGRDLHNPAQQRGPRWPSAPPRCSPRAPAHRTPSPARGQGSGSSGFQFKKNLHTGCLISFSPRQGRSLREPGSEISEGRLQGQTGAPPLTWGCHRVGHTHTHTRADTPPPRVSASTKAGPGRRGAGVGCGEDAKVSGGSFARGGAVGKSHQASGHPSPARAGWRALCEGGCVTSGCLHSQDHQRPGLPVPVSQVPCGAVARVFAEALGAGSLNPARDAPGSRRAGRTAGRAGRLGVCPAGAGHTLWCTGPHGWPGLLRRSQAGRRDLQAREALTSR